MKRLLLCLLWWAIALPATRAALTTDEIRHLVASYGMQYMLIDELQRPIDPRLAKIEKEGLDGCGLFQGKAYVVHEAAEANALSGKLAPGDRLVLTGENWRDAKVTFAGNGTEAAPILIQAEHPGQVVFSGDAAVVFHGSHLVITGLEFRKVTLTRKGATVLRLGRDQTHPANDCIVHRIKIEDCNSPQPADWPTVRVWYLTAAFGRNNTIAHSTFTGLHHLGQMIGASSLPVGELQRLHILNNHFGDRPFLDSQNGYEIIQIGYSGEVARSAGSLIQGNTFENCDGENEIISLKASDIVVRDNTFAGCQGVLNMRTARRVLVQGNLFESRGRPNTGGVRMQGWGHVIIENTFRDQKESKNINFWPVSMMTADTEEYGDEGKRSGYGRSKHILIARNRFEHCEHRVAVGVVYGPGYPFLPRDIHVHDNIFTGSRATTAFEHVVADPTGEVQKTLVESGNQFSP